MPNGYNPYSTRYRNTTTYRPGFNSPMNRGRAGGVNTNLQPRNQMPMRDTAGMQQKRVVPQRGSYQGLPMSKPGNAFQGQRQGMGMATRKPYAGSAGIATAPPPGLEGLPRSMWKRAWELELDENIKGGRYYKLPPQMQKPQLPTEGGVRTNAIR